VNHSAPKQALSSGDSDITLLAAGLNRLASIVSGGDVNIGGTGILLVDEIRLGINSVLNFLSNTDLYGENGGSVAVFTKETEDTYRCINGSVPGILDEAYTVEGVKLILPGGSRLLLTCNGAATDRETGEVVYYNRSNAKEVLDPEADYDYEETSGSLSIGRDAELVVESGASITLTGMLSLSSDHVTTLVPELKVADNGILTVNGSVSGREISVGGAASLSGTGSVSGTISVSSPDCLDDCSAEFASATLHVDGGGTLDSIRLRDSHLYVGGGTTVESVTSSGSCQLTFPDSVRLNALDISGALQITTTEYYGPDNGTAELGGPISGGTLELSSGVYTLRKDCTLSGESASISCGGVTVYDYSDAGVMQGSIGTVPLVMSPESVTPVDPDSHSIPVQIVYMAGTKQIGGHVTASAADWGSDAYDTDHEGNDQILPSELYAFAEAFAEAYYEEHNVSFRPSCVELQYLENGVLRTAYLDPDDSALPVDDVYLIRILFFFNVSLGQGGGSVSRTSTSFTGTGVLGGANAGSVRFGASTFDLSSVRPVTDDEKEDGDRTEAAAPELRTEVRNNGRTFTVRSFLGGREIFDLGGVKVTAKIPFVFPAGWQTDRIFVVFRGEDGSLTAFQARYSDLTETLSFDTDRLGECVVVCLDFDGELFSPEFYEALRQLPETAALF